MRARAQGDRSTVGAQTHRDGPERSSVIRPAVEPGGIALSVNDHHRTRAAGKGDGLRPRLPGACSHARRAVATCALTAGAVLAAVGHPAGSGQ